MGKRLVDVIKQFTPGQSLWYGRKVFEEAVLDTIEWLINPDAAEDRWENLEDRLDDEGRKLWWRQGAFTGS